MKRALSIVILITAAFGGGFVYYRYGLSDQDRQSISQTVESAKGLLQEVELRVKPVLSQIRDGSGSIDEGNRDSTRRQWDELGI